MFLNAMLWLVNISELKLIFRFSCCLFFCANKANIVIYYIPFTSIQNNLTTKI